MNARLLWLATGLMVLAAYALVMQPGEQSVTGIEQHAHALYDQANANETKVRRSAELSRVKKRVDEDLRELVAVHLPGTVTARVLRLFADEGKRFSVDFRSITPESNSAAASSEADPLIGTDWSVVMRGHFRDVIAMLSDLPRHDVLLNLNDVELSSGTVESAAPPTLDVTLHTTVYRVHSFSPPEDAHVKSAAR